MVNPIKDDRIVNDYTFAVRFKNFINQEYIRRNEMIDCASYEEWNYIKCIADKLLYYQLETATDKDEIDYLKRLKII